MKLALIFSLASGLLFAQHLEVSGRVMDPQGKPVAGAPVDLLMHSIANAALTVGAWHGWSGSLRMRAVNHYRLDGDNRSIVATGHTVLDLGVAKQLNHTVELNFSADNLTNRDYWEPQNYVESRVTPDAPIIARIHSTPAYPLTAVAGITLRFGGE